MSAPAETASLLLRRERPAPPAPTRPRPQDRRRRGRSRIRCPRCGWEPRQGDLWACICGEAWHTFDTGGVCPGCGYPWEHTQCLRCLEWSPHAEWYAPEGAPDD